MRRAVGVGMRQINLLLVPAAAFTIVLATPIVRLVYQRGSFTPHSTHLVSIALFWFALSLPFGGLNLLLTRTFFAVQRPWIPTRLAAVNIVVDVIVSVALYKPLGIAGLVIGTLAANAVMTALQLVRLREGFSSRLEGAQTTMITARILVASALLAAVSWAVWYLLDRLLGRSLPAQIVSVGAAGAAGLWLYSRAVLAMRVPEAHQVSRLIRAVPVGLPGKARIARRVLRSSLRGGPTVVTDRFGFHYNVPDDREPFRLIRCCFPFVGRAAALRPSPGHDLERAPVATRPYNSHRLMSWCHKCTAEI